MLSHVRRKRPSARWFAALAAAAAVLLAANSGPGAAPAALAGGATLVTPDPDVGASLHTAIRLDAQGIPTVVYFDAGSFRTKVLRCGDATCSRGNSLEPLEAAGPGSLAHGVVLDAAARPVISYVEGATNDLMLLRCADARCSRGASHTVTRVDSSTSVGKFTALALDASGRPVIAYHDVDNGHLRLVRCGDATCSAANTISIVDRVGVPGLHPSLQLDAQQRPVLAYYASGPQDLRLARCTDPTCTSPPSFVVLDSAGDVGQYASMVLDGAGRPVVSYYDATLRKLKVLRCPTPECVPTPSPAVIEQPGIGGLFTSLRLDSRGYPVVGYYHASESHAMVLRCGDAECRTANRIRAIDTTPTAGWYLSLALDASDVPVLSYVTYPGADVRFNNGTLRVARCVSPACNTPPVARDDTATFTGAAQLIDVLANDSDADGDPLTVAIAVPPLGGTARVVSGGISYTPAAGTTADVFAYEVSDGAGGTATAKVVLAGAGPSPEAVVPGVPPGSLMVEGESGTFELGPGAQAVGVGRGAAYDGGVTVIFPQGAATAPFAVDVQSTAQPPAEAPTVPGARLLGRTLRVQTALRPQRRVGVVVNLTATELANDPPGRIVAAALTPQGPRFMPVTVLDAGAGVVRVEADALGPLAFYVATGAVPELQAPGPGVLLEHIGTELQWANPPGARWWHLQVVPFADDGPGVDLVQAMAPSATSRFSLDPPALGVGNYVLLPGMSYTWRVRTAGTAGEPHEGDWTPWAVGSFVTRSSLSRFIEPLSPAPGQTAPSLTPHLAWRNADPQVFYYEVQVSKDPAFGPDAFLYWALVHAGVSSPPSSYAIPQAFPLEPGTTYYWRVRPRIQGDGQPEPWSTAWSFRSPPG